MLGISKRDMVYGITSDQDTKKTFSDIGGGRGMG